MEFVGNGLVFLFSCVLIFITVVLWGSVGMSFADSKGWNFTRIVAFVVTAIPATLGGWLIYLMGF